MNELLSICLGIGLAAASGLRVFVPFLVAGLAAASGHLTLSPGFEWIATEPAIAVFAIATFLELLAYQIPWLDNMLDVVAAPAAVMAGALLSAAVITGLDPMMKWTLALIAGGGVAALFQGSTTVVRAASTLGTGGIANPIFAVAESSSSFLLAAAALLVPLLAVGLAALALLVVARLALRRRRTSATHAA